jgi:hypothetical protein
MRQGPARPFEPRPGIKDSKALWFVVDFSLCHGLAATRMSCLERAARCRASSPNHAEMAIRVGQYGRGALRRTGKRERRAGPEEQVPAAEVHDAVSRLPA